jgi:hypothetical protein
MWPSASMSIASAADPVSVDQVVGEARRDDAELRPGRDPQLEKAITTILELIEKNDKNKFPPVPAYPDKR